MENAKKANIFNLPSPLFVDGYIGWFNAGEKGRGMVALKDIPANTVIERDPVITMPNDILRTTDGKESILESYIFRWGVEDDAKVTPQCCWPLGNIPIINHTENPNCDIRNDYNNNVMELFTLRAIAQGEEITIDYDLDDDIWFEVKP